MISAGDFRKGVTFEMDGKVYVVVDFQHVKPGKGAAFVRTKIKNVVTGQFWSRLSILRTSIPSHISKERICNILTPTEIFIILWILRLSTCFRLTMI